MSEMLPNWLLKRAALAPDRIAVEFEGREITFKQLHEDAEDFAGRLGVFIGAGDRAALLLRNRYESIVIIHALFYLGAEIVMLNSKLTGRELAWQLKDSKAACLLSETFYDGTLASIKKETDTPIYRKEQLTDRTEAEPAAEYDLGKTATVMYTSGTTGKPKGVIQTFGNHWWSAVGSALNLGLSEKDSWYCAVPLFHISGFSILMRSVIYGMKIILTERFDAKDANARILKGDVTIISVVTVMLTRMIRETGEAVYPGSLRCVLLGGGPAPLPILEACLSRNIPVFQSYGMTETSSQIVTLPPEYSLSKLGSAGKPLFPASLKIMDGGKEAPAGVIGEIAVKGPNVTPGYLGNPEATAEAVKDNWLYTGDMGFVDEEGFLYVRDRRSDLLISGGENVYPAEIESVLSGHPAVEEAGAAGKADSTWGQVPAAFIVLKPGLRATEEEIIHWCRQRLASYKVPAQVIFCDELPRNASNKLLRRELKKRLEELK